MTYKELFKEAKWVSPSQVWDTPFIRGSFSLDDIDDIEEANITICGLGFFIPYLNGKKMTEDLFIPLYTDYHHFDNQFCYANYGEVLGHRIICPRYDIKGFLEKGKNVVGIFLGPGHYKYQLSESYGEVKASYRLEIIKRDGRVIEVFSDESLKWAKSHVIKSDLIYGEDHDYAYYIEGWNERDFEDDSWENVLIASVPDTSYYLQESPADRPIRKIEGKIIKETKDFYIYDFGENITGYPLIYSDTDGIVTLRAFEAITEDEQYNHKQKASFLPRGKARTMHMHFTWHGFRYLEISKNAKILEVLVIHANVNVSSSFESDNKVLNWLYEATIRTQLNNMHCGIPSDCPHIERRGYTGDGQLMAETVLMILDAKSFYRKWIDDIKDCQDTVSGHVQYTAPYTRSGGGPGGWGSAIVEVPYVYYSFYKDKDLLKDMYPNMLRYLDYLEAKSENDLVVSDQEGLWCLGDWCTAKDIEIPEPYVNTFFYIKAMKRILEIERILSIDDNKDMLEKRIEIKVKALYDNYYDKETGNFCENVQGSNAFALYLGLGDERTFNNMVSFYRGLGMYDTGIFGTDLLTGQLFERGQADLAFLLMSSEGEYSFGNWMNKGQTTLLEYWTFERSLNHPMFGAAAKYLFTYILGIKQKKDTYAYEDFYISPLEIKGLNYAKGHIETCAGRIGLEYKKKDGRIDFVIDIEADREIDFIYGPHEMKAIRGKNKFSIDL